MKVKKLKINRIVFLLVALVIIIGGIIALTKNIQYKKSYEYKLEQKGYSETDITKIKSELSNKEIDKVLELKYNKALVSFMKQKYFIFDNVERYLNYFSQNSSLSHEKIVSVVNARADEEWYEDVKKTNVKKEELMLVNRYYGLTEDYEPEDLIPISGKYAYEGKYMSESIYDYLAEMLDDAKTTGYTLVITQGYRSYEDQKTAYDSYANYHSVRETDLYAARAGHSEYQTGLSLSIVPYNIITDDITKSEENEWLQKNAHKYGFILRYPKGKEDITGFSYEPWRFRYVGKDAASYIYENDITFDEYYAYYKN